MRPGKAVFAATHRGGRVAPIPAVHGTAIVPQRSAGERGKRSSSLLMAPEGAILVHRKCPLPLVPQKALQTDTLGTDGLEFCVFF
jgi:hypothetical protein